MPYAFDPTKPPLLADFPNPYSHTTDAVTKDIVDKTFYLPDQVQSFTAGSIDHIKTEQKYACHRFLRWHILDGSYNYGGSVPSEDRIIRMYCERSVKAAFSANSGLSLDPGGNFLTPQLIKDFNFQSTQIDVWKDAQTTVKHVGYLPGVHFVSWVLVDTIIYNFYTTKTTQYSNVTHDLHVDNGFSHAQAESVIWFFNDVG
jgi:hypothetical protein